MPSLDVALLESRTPKTIKNVSRNSFNNGTTDEEYSLIPNVRAYALSPDSLRLLGTSVLEKLNDSGKLGIYDAMQIWESDGPATLHFTEEDLDLMYNRNDTAVASHSLLNNILGAVVEDEALVTCIWDELNQNQHVDLISPATVTQIIKSSQTSKTSHHNSKHPSSFHKLICKQETDSEGNLFTVKANLLVAADGANSHVRRNLGIFPTVSIGYGRKAVTCTVVLEKEINCTAFQRFQPNGPIALLPVWDEERQSIEKKPLYANVVWSTTPDEANILQNMSELEFVQKLNNMLQSGPINTSQLFSNNTKKIMPLPLGTALHGFEMLAQSINTGLSMSGWTERRKGFEMPPLIHKLAGQRVSFDLNLMQAKNYVASNVALVGDAAHTIHPMAGQGLNLGMADVECLAKNIQQVVESGMGIQSNPGLKLSLQQYESERQREVLKMMGGIQLLHEVFSTTFAPAIYLRSLGMNVVNSTGLIRRYLAGIAAGVNGGVCEKIH